MQCKNNQLLTDILSDSPLYPSPNTINIFSYGKTYKWECTPILPDLQSQIDVIKQLITTE
jgi:hypothetical protein